MSLNKKILALLGAVLLIGVVLLPGWANAQSGNTFLTGNIMTASNLNPPSDGCPGGDGQWHDPLSVCPGGVVEFRIVAQNQTPGVTANNVKVTANFPANRSPNPTATGTVSADNFAAISDTVTINVVGGSSQKFAPISGHTRVCQGTTCSTVADTILTSGVNVGNLGPGESAQVLFKAHVTNVVEATPTPTPTPTPAPGVGQQVQEVIQQVVQQVTQQQEQQVTIQQAAAPTPAPSPAPAPAPKELPKAGGEILAVPLFSSLMGAGWLLRRRFSA